MSQGGIDGERVKEKSKRPVFEWDLKSKTEGRAAPVEGNSEDIRREKTGQGLPKKRWAVLSMAGVK